MNSMIVETPSLKEFIYNFHDCFTIEDALKKLHQMSFYIASPSSSINCSYMLNLVKSTEWTFNIGVKKNLNMVGCKLREVKNLITDDKIDWLDGVVSKVSIPAKNIDNALKGKFVSFNYDGGSQGGTRLVFVTGVDAYGYLCGYDVKVTMESGSNYSAYRNFSTKLISNLQVVA